jgi:predicted transcriptional regulator
MVSNRKTVIADLPPSSKLIYYVLKNNGAMTRRQITDESRLSYQTARYGLEQLENSNVVTKEEPDISEQSQKVYSLV